MTTASSTAAHALRDAERRQLAFTLLQTTHLLGLTLVLPLGPQLSRTLFLTPAAFGLLASAYALTAGAAGFTALLFRRHTPGNRLLVATAASFTLATLSCACATGLSSLLAARVAAGAAGGLLSVWLPAVLPPAQLRSTLAGRPFLLVTFALPAALLAAWLGSWHAPLLALAATGAFATSLLVCFPPSAGSPPAHEAHRHLRVLLNHPDHRTTFLVNGLLTFSGMLLVTFFSGIMVANAGFTEAHLPLIFLIGGTLTLLSLPRIERLTAKMSPWRTFAITALFSTAAILVLTHLPPGQRAWGLLAGVFFMLTNAVRFVPAASLGRRHRRYTARFMGLNALVQHLAAGAAMLVAGLIVVHKAGAPFERYDRLGWLSLGFLFAALVIALRLMPSHSAPRAPA